MHDISDIPGTSDREVFSTPVTCNIFSSACFYEKSIK